MIEHNLRSASGEYERQSWFFPGPSDRAHPLGILLDGEIYLEKMEVWPILQELEAQGRIPSMAWLLVSYETMEARSRDYMGDERFSRFMAEDAVNWATGQDPLIQRSGHFIGGLSLSGLASAYLACHYPAVFSRALCQSGSFWNWVDREVSLPPTTARFWLSVGSKETQTNVTHQPSGLVQRISQIEGVEWAARKLEALGGTVRCRHFGGGHTVSAWKEDFAPGLRWLFGR